MRNPHSKKLLGDHMSIYFKSRPVSLDEAVCEMNKLYEISDIVDDLPNLGTPCNGDEYKSALQKIYKLIYHPES